MLIRAKDYHIVIGSGEIRTGTAFSDWKAVEIDLLTGERKDRPKPGVVGMLDWFEEAGRVVKLNPGNVSTEAKKYRRLRILGHQYEDQDNDEEQGIEEQGTEEQGTDNNKKDTKQEWDDAGFDPDDPTSSWNKVGKPKTRKHEGEHQDKKDYGPNSGW